MKNIIRFVNVNVVKNIHMDIKQDMRNQVFIKIIFYKIKND
jgi:hypothetical protein